MSSSNYLLRDEPAWQAARSRLTAVWFVRVEASLRRSRLHARHVAFGKTPEAADAWVAEVDEPNARLVEASAVRADAVLELTGDPL